MNVVDSCGWLEYIADGANADFFESPIRDRGSLLVPSVAVYEVFRIMLQRRDEQEARRAVMLMCQGAIVDLDARMSVGAAELAAETQLPMADSIIYATARAHDATLWTQDADFEGLDGVEYVARRS